MAKSQFQKKRERENKLKRIRNVAQNVGKPQYAVHVDLPGRGWSHIKNLRNMKSVEKFVEDVESARAKGDVEIIAGRIYSMVTGKVVKEIPAYKPTALAGTLPEKKLPESVRMYAE